MIFIEKRIIDFSKVQIYIYDLDLIEKMTKDYLERKCVSKADYFRFIIEEYFRYKKDNDKKDNVLVKEINEIKELISDSLKESNNDEVLKNLKAISLMVDNLKNIQECVNKDNTNNFNELVNMMALIYNLGVASYNKGFLNKGVSLSELLDDKEILSKFNFKFGDSNGES